MSVYSQVSACEQPPDPPCACLTCIRNQPQKPMNFWQWQMHGSLVLLKDSIGNKMCLLPNLEQFS